MGMPGNFGEGGGWSYLIDFGNGRSEVMGGAAGWTHNDGDREIRDVLVENVWVLGGPRSSCHIRLVNRDSGGFTSVMENVVLRNIYFRQDPIDFTDQIGIAGLDGKVIQTNEPYFHWSEIFP
jgi:hypothetical protein